jgi:hypothetical protein
VVIRDRRGNCLATSNKFIDHVTYVAMAEAIGQREGLLLAVQHNGENWLIVQCRLPRGGRDDERWWLPVDGCFGHL